jgi:hypothetical protein
VTKLLRTIAEKYVAAAEDWYPCFAENTVRVKLTEYVGYDRITFRLSVWGKDDTGMEKDVWCEDRHRDPQRELLWLEYRNMPLPITKGWLKKNGFVPA